jgi:hypothetical protein
MLLPFGRPVVEAVDLSVMTARPWVLSRDLQHTIQIRDHVQILWSFTRFDTVDWFVSLELSSSVPGNEGGLMR